MKIIKKIGFLFFSLCRPSSKRIQGQPFMPILAQPIDLFPHTAHCELVVLLERIKEANVDNSVDIQGQPAVNQ